MVDENRSHQACRLPRPLPRRLPAVTPWPTIGCNRLPLNLDPDE